MSLLETALDALGDAADSQAEGWFETLVDSLDVLVDGTSNEELKSGGKEALQVLRDNDAKFIGLGKKSLIMFIAHVAVGDTDKATKEWLRNKATASEIIDSILNDALEVEKVRKENEALIAEAIEVAKLLLKGARFLLPLILAL